MSFKTRNRETYAIYGMLCATALCLNALGQTHTWKDVSVDSDWFNAANWDGDGQVPGTGAEVLIPPGAAILLTNQTAQLNAFTMNGGTLTFSNWTTRLRATEVVLDNTATLTHPVQSATSTNTLGEWIPDARVWIACSNLTLGADAVIDVDGAGYAGGNSAHRAGYGPGGGASGYGAGYGGRGGQYFGGLHWGGPAYGVSNAPVQPGSGGGGGVGGAGGGAVRIEASGIVTIHGTVTADGISGEAKGDGGGSGGAIFIDCLRLDGSKTGLLSADGENGYDTGGGGGGGRIAVWYNETAQTNRPGVRFTTGFGNSSRGFRGESGTVYFSGTNVFLSETLGDDLFTDVRLFVEDWTNWSPDSIAIADCDVVFANEGFTLHVTNDLQVDSGGHLGMGIHSRLLCGGNLVLTNGGALSVFAGATNGMDVTHGALVSVDGDLVVGNESWVYPWSHDTNGGSVRFALNNLTVLAGGGFDADQKGFAGGTTAGGYGPGSTSLQRVGAGYGGRGSRAYGFYALFGPTYGSITTPLLPGSGGGGGVGGDGGGLIWIEAEGTVAIYGTLTANGGGRTGDRGGGGSGGGIYVACQRFEGDAGGLLSAAGGSNADTGGPGGGGRIAVHVDPQVQNGHRPGVRYTTPAGIPSGRSLPAENGTTYLSDSSMFRSNLLANGLFDATAVYADDLNFTHWVVDSLTVDDCRFVFGTQGLHLAVTNDVILRNGADLGLPENGVLACANLRIESTGALTVFGGDTNATATDYGALVTVQGDMILETDAWVQAHAHPTLGGSPVFRMRNLTVAAGGGFLADGTGYSGGLAYGAEGYGPGRGRAKGQFGSGGGYGGRGGDEVYGGNAGGSPYASSNAPALPGSGAGALGGGNGGGLIRIEAAGTVLQNGILSANGNAMTAGNSRAGGGSGGGIFVMCRRFAGGLQAEMRADGGNGGSEKAGGGGGGRIAVWHGAAPKLFPRIVADDAKPIRGLSSQHDDYLGTTSVAYGTGGGQDGAPGTALFFAAPPQGSLFILR